MSDISKAEIYNSPFSAESVVSYLESEYNIKFERVEEIPERNIFGYNNRFAALYEKRLEIEINDGEFRDGGGYVGLSVWDKENHEGIGVPCEDMESVLKVIDRYKVSKKTGHDQLTLF